MTTPPTGPLQSKVWGTTQLLFRHHGIECHLLRLEKGGYSSRHRHQHKWNRFVCLSGKLLVTIFREWDEGEDVTTIEKGQVTDVPPGTWHRFDVLESGEVLEICWVSLDNEDIERDGTGGRV